MTDTITRKIPDLFPVLIASAAVCKLIQHPASAARAIPGLFLLSIPMLLLALKWGGLGGGDIKLTAACGLFLGADALLTGAFLAALFALLTLFLHRALQKIIALLYAPHGHTSSKKQALDVHRKIPPRSSPDTFPFGPFLAAGFILAALAG